MRHHVRLVVTAFAGSLLLAPVAHGRSGIGVQVTGEITANTMKGGPFDSDSWAIGNLFVLWSEPGAFEELVPGEVALQYLDHPTITAGTPWSQAIFLDDTVPMIFGDDPLGDSISWTTPIDGGGSFELHLWDAEGLIFDPLSNGNVWIEGADLEFHLARIATAEGEIVIRVDLFSKYVPAPGAWCLVAGAAVVRRRRRG